MDAQDIRVGQAVYDRGGELIGRVRAYDAQSGALTVGEDLQLPRDTIQGVDGDGDIHLFLHKDELSRGASPPPDTSPT